jgi:hypothetical protein
MLELYTIAQHLRQQAVCFALQGADIGDDVRDAPDAPDDDTIWL